MDDASSSGSFFAYIMSMWRRVHHTTDVLFASSHLHFVLHASTLAQEHVANFQMLALLYLFPLASVDLYVPDVKVDTILASFLFLPSDHNTVLSPSQPPLHINLSRKKQKRK